MDIHMFLSSPVVKRSMDILEDGVVLQFLIDGISFEVGKKGEKLESRQGIPERPFLVFLATSDAIKSLAIANSSEEFGSRFAACYLKKDVDIKLMAPPGTALTYGIPLMFKHLGIKPNLIGGKK